MISTTVQKHIVQLLKDLCDEDEYIRFAAARTLSEVGGNERAVIDALVEASRDRIWFVRLAAAQALEELNPTETAVMQVMAERLSDEHEDIREWAAWALGKIGPPARAFGRGLGDLALKDPVFYVRITAAEALGKIALAEDTEIIEMLEQVRKDEDPEVSASAADALSAIWRKSPDS